MDRDMDKTFSRVKIGDRFFIEEITFGDSMLYAGKVKKLFKKYFVVVINFETKLKSTKPTEYKFHYDGSMYGQTKGILRVPTAKLENQYKRKNLIMRTRLLFTMVKMDAFTTKELETIHDIVDCHYKQRTKD